MLFYKKIFQRKFKVYKASLQIRCSIFFNKFSVIVSYAIALFVFLLTLVYNTSNLDYICNNLDYNEV